jgi:outer membrane lipoprotein-sorting protein
MPDGWQDNTTKTVQRRLWWQRPGCWREEQRYSETEQSVTIICDGQSWQYSTSAKVLFTNARGLYDQAFVGYEIRNIASSPAIEDVSGSVQLLDPSFLLVSHDLEAIGETVHTGCEVVVVRGLYRKHRDLLYEDFFWATADEYAFFVDKEYGILLRYAYVLNGREVAVSLVDAVTFDQPIPASTFSPGSVADL